MNQFMTMLFSMDSIWGRVLRACLLAIAAGITAGTIGLPAWVATLAAAIAGFIPAGESNSKPDPVK